MSTSRVGAFTESLGKVIRRGEEEEYKHANLEWRLMLSSALFTLLSAVGVALTGYYWSSQKTNGNWAESNSYINRATFTDTTYDYLTEVVLYAGATIDMGFFFVVAYIIYTVFNTLVWLHLYIRRAEKIRETAEKELEKSIMHKALRYTFFTAHYMYPLHYIVNGIVIAMINAAIFFALGMRWAEFNIFSALFTIAGVSCYLIATFVMWSHTSDSVDDTIKKQVRNTGFTKPSDDAIITGTADQWIGWNVWLAMMIIGMGLVLTMIPWIGYWTVIPAFVSSGIGNYYWTAMSFEVFWTAFLGFPILFKHYMPRVATFVGPFWCDFFYRLLPLAVVAVNFGMITRLGQTTLQVVF